MAPVGGGVHLHRAGHRRAAWGKPMWAPGGCGTRLTRAGAPLLSRRVIVSVARLGRPCKWLARGGHSGVGRRGEPAGYPLFRRVVEHPAPCFTRDAAEYRDPAMRSSLRAGHRRLPVALL